jgi:hypothetical protein
MLHQLGTIILIGSLYANASVSLSGDSTVDDHCFFQYSRTAGLCNTSAGKDEALFKACLGKAKEDFVRCCVSDP